jgi:hypothetical protein
MAQFLIIAATLLGLYRQIRQQNAANALQRMESLQGEWDSPKMIYARLAVAIWRKHAKSPTPDIEAQVPLAWLCNFFENLSDLYLEGYLTWSEIENTWGSSLVLWWTALEDTIKGERSGSLNAYTGFEFLAKRAEAVAAKRGDDWSVAPDGIPRLMDTQIGRNRTRLRLLREIDEGVMPEEPVTQRVGGPPQRGARAR